MPTNSNTDEVSEAARNFATTRYPFGPYHVIFQSSVKDRLVIDELAKHALELKVDMRIAGYRHKSVDNGYSVLIFVEDIDSFCFLNNEANWPKRLASAEFSIKKPMIPPQLCLVISNVSLNIDWEEFVIDLKENYQDAVNVIRLKNRNQRPVPMVKVEFACRATRESILQSKRMNIGYMNYKITEYLAPVQVLICGNCCQIGHFQKNCPLKNVTVCKTCGEQCPDIKEHECSKELKCIRCGECHKSNDPKCQTIKSYRAALTRNLLQRPASTSKGYDTNNFVNDYPLAFAKQKIQPFNVKSTDVTETSIHVAFMSKLDLFLTDIKSELKKTNDSIEIIRNEMQAKWEETNNKIVSLEVKMKAIEQDVHERTRKLNNSIEELLRSIEYNKDISIDDKSDKSHRNTRSKSSQRLKNKQ